MLFISLLRGPFNKPFEICVLKSKSCRIIEIGDVSLSGVIEKKGCDIIRPRILPTNGLNNVFFNLTFCFYLFQKLFVRINVFCATNRS